MGSKEIAALGSDAAYEAEKWHVEARGYELGLALPDPAAGPRLSAYLSLLLRWRASDRVQGVGAKTAAK